MCYLTHLKLERDFFAVLLLLSAFGEENITSACASASAYTVPHSHTIHSHPVSQAFRLCRCSVHVPHAQAPASTISDVIKSFLCVVYHFHRHFVFFFVASINSRAKCMRCYNSKRALQSANKETDAAPKKGNKRMREALR